MDDEWRVAAAVRQPSGSASAPLAFGLVLTGVLVLLQWASLRVGSPLPRVRTTPDTRRLTT